MKDGTDLSRPDVTPFHTPGTKVAAASPDSVHGGKEKLALAEGDSDEEGDPLVEELGDALVEGLGEADVDGEGDGECAASDRHTNSPSLNGLADEELISVTLMTRKNTRFSTSPT